MSTDASGPGPADAAHAAVLADRARRLLVGGLIGTHILAVPAALLFLVLDGPRGLVSGLFGLALVLFFHTVGQATQIRFAGAAPPVLMRASLLSYGLRAALLGALLLGWVNLPPESVARANPTAVGVVAVAGVVGWMVGLVRTHSRLRIPVYDEPAAVAADGPDDYDTASEITSGPRVRT